MPISRSRTILQRITIRLFADTKHTRSVIFHFLPPSFFSLSFWTATVCFMHWSRERDDFQDDLLPSSCLCQDNRPCNRFVHLFSGSTPLSLLILLLPLFPLPLSSSCARLTTHPVIAGTSPSSSAPLIIRPVGIDTHVSALLFVKTKER